MKFQTIERHIRQVTRLRTEFNQGARPWQLIRKPKYMKTRDFEKKIRLLRRHESAIREKLPIYLLQ